MARKLRIQYPGAIYHPPSPCFGGTSVMNRGDHQERIFCGDDDRKVFLATLAEGCGKTGWQVHSYCLPQFKPVPRGWCVGSKQFRAEMLEYIEEQWGKWHYGAGLANRQRPRRSD